MQQCCILFSDKVEKSIRNRLCGPWKEVKNMVKVGVRKLTEHEATLSFLTGTTKHSTSSSNFHWHIDQEK